MDHTPSNRIVLCPSCNSPKITYYDLRKRGLILIVSAIILALFFFILLPIAKFVSILCILILGSKGIYLVIKDGSYYICQKCLLWIDKNGNNLGK